MSAGTVVLMRHGQTPWNLARRLQGQADIDLDDVGVAQAERAAGPVARLRPAAIVASDLVRARRTAEAVAEITGLAVVTDERLRERAFGTWEGLNHTEIEGGWPAEYEIWGRGEQPEGIGMEDRGEVGSRVAAAVIEHAARLGDDENLLVVTHGAAIGAGISALLGHDAAHWHGISGLGNCHWSVLHPSERGTPAWRLHAHNVGVPG
ncbi:histidine phosphatase family protein [Pseudactinotalea sp.]|uniref:histidine phosphatase family protein n=1 Tax=Pseudactinotalea sp. TaxID=1926260 RepID=UPI003B3B30A9